MTTAIWWVRRDLRLADNQALAAALERAGQVVPAFVLDPALLASPYVGDKRVAFLFRSLRCLDEALRARGSRLVVRRGEPQAELAALREETGADGVWAEEDVSPYAVRRDAAVAQALPLHLTGGLMVHPPGSVLKADGDPYVVYSYFRRTWKDLPRPVEEDLLPVPGALPPVPEVESLGIPEAPALTESVPFPPGEAEARRRLASFCEGPGAPVFRYARDRDRLDREGTSRLSPYLRFGLISAREAAVCAQAVAEAAAGAAEAAGGEDEREGAETWLDELIWREFYLHILHHYPRVRGGNFRAEYDGIAWENDEEAFAAWCEGRTGYPVVDAAMCQLVRSGWMHNRARMIVASFLVKDLLVDWRWGERFFMQHLLDGDPAANNGNWQWTAGTGTDAAPYFRIFNPVLQGKKHDPNGAFVRRWLPELGDVPGEYLHAPWEMPEEVQRRAGCVIGQDYPAPVIDHGWARERTLAAYSRAREGAE